MGDGDKARLALALCGLRESDPDAALVTGAYLALARGAVLAARNPFSDDPSSEEWEERYDELQCEIAADLYARRGAEGEVSHRENGVDRRWGNPGVSRHLLRRIVPRAKVPGR